MGADHKKTHRRYVEFRCVNGSAGPPLCASRWFCQHSRDNAGAWMSCRLNDRLGIVRSRLINVINDFTKQCHTMMIHIAVSGRRAAWELGWLVALNGKASGCDNGAVYTSITMFDGLRCTGIPLPFIQPDKSSEFASSCSGLTWNRMGRLHEPVMDKKLTSQSY